MSEALRPAIVAGASLQIGRARSRGAIPGDRERLAQQLIEVRPAEIGFANGAIRNKPGGTASRDFTIQALA